MFLRFLFELLSFQLDGANVHRNPEFMRYLDSQFGTGVLALSSDKDGLRGTEWASHSPDLNPLDFFVWGYVKSLVYRPMPKTIEELVEKIKYVFEYKMPHGMVRSAQLSVKSRASKYVQKDGGWFE